jgi:hypothetical protein
MPGGDTVPVTSLLPNRNATYLGRQIEGYPVPL